MKLRQAIKIQKAIEEPHTVNFKSFHWSRETIWKSRTVCRRHNHMKKKSGMPYIPDDDELTERLQMMASILVDCVCDDEEEKDKLKEQIWSE